MQADQVVSLYVDMEARGIGLWLMGGWGIDALLGRQTRDHHDLDVLVEVAKLELLVDRLGEFGFKLMYVWDDEAWWVTDAAWSGKDTRPTAFVYGAADGREIDVHVVGVDARGVVATLWNCPYKMTRAGLRGRGAVAGVPVRCLTSDMQQVAHTGYELPLHHVSEMRLLAEPRDIAELP